MQRKSIWTKRVVEFMTATTLCCFQFASFAADIVVDTGHTPGKPGATAANGRVEYLYNKDMSNAVSQNLRTSGYQVLQVAADGQEITLSERATKAPEAKLFVSIHHDSMPQDWIDSGKNRQLSGFAVFVSHKNPFYARSLSCAEHISKQLIAIGEKPSLYHATPITGENRPLINQPLGIHQFDDLVVLKTAPIPAVLVEVGVIVNPEEAVRLSQPETIGAISKAIAKGIQACQPQ